jgi:AcrR family transcriptional regulator
MSEPAAPTPVASPHTSASTRRRVRAIDAFIDLVLEGNLPPTTVQVAERAGISAATFFRYFDTLDVLRRDAGGRLLERFRLLPLPDIGKGTLEQRIEHFARNRVALWEKVHLLALLQRSAALRDPGAAQMIDFVRDGMAKEVREHFAPELRRLTAARRDDAVALIATLTSVESWDQFRNAYGRSAAQTRRAWARVIQSVLDEGPAG